jgi:hypothetical protein
MNTPYIIEPGENIANAVAEMLEIANKSGNIVESTFGGHKFCVSPGGSIVDIVSDLLEKDCIAHEAEAVFAVADVEYHDSVKARDSSLVHEAGRWAKHMEALMMHGSKTIPRDNLFPEGSCYGHGISFVRMVKFLGRAWIHGPILLEWFDQVCEV